MTAPIDLHIHTSCSDGVSTPAEVLEIARKKKLAAFSITDHDSIEAWFEIEKLLKKGDPEIITGVELSAGTGGEDIHILGYLFDPETEILVEALEDFRVKRNRRAAKMLKELEKFGIYVPMDLVREIAGNSATGRPHVADAMVKAKGVGSYEEAFSKYIGFGCPAYVPKDNQTPKGAIDLIHQAGGLAFLAHPGIARVLKYADEFVDCGLDGVEVYHPYNRTQTTNKLNELVARRKILASGGSDYHGRTGQYGMIGSQPVSIDLLEAMKKKLNQRGLS